MNNKLYIRFGKIPLDEKSKSFYNGEYIVKEEDGVSVYDCTIIDSNVRIILPIITTSSTLNCIDGFVESYMNGSEDTPIYLVTGNLVGYGSDNEPLIKDVDIIKQIDPYELFDYPYLFKDIKIDSDEIPSDKVYYVKINDSSWYKASKSFYEKYKGKKIITDTTLYNPNKNVEELYNSKLV